MVIVPLFDSLGPDARAFVIRLQVKKVKKKN